MKKLFILLLVPFISSAQIDTVNLQLNASHLFPSFPYKSSYSAKLDQRQGMNYIYSANMEFGLGIYQYSSPGTLNNITNLPNSTFNNLEAGTVEIKGTSLFIGIGNYHNNNNTSSGLAILDITNPATPVIKDIWDSAAFTHGINHIVLDGDYAYLSTMSDGIIILNIADENNIRFESTLSLDLSWPVSSTNAHNARGMMIKNDSLFVCFDRGGLRVVDVTDKANPSEIYKYINTSLTSVAAAAYNDIAIKGNYAFVSVDYCGMEIIDISSAPFTAVQWYNPWGCNFTNWSGAEIHTNEVRLGSHDSLLFVSGARSELFVFDVTDPLNTVKKGEYINLSDSIASNGLDVYNGKVLLSLLRAAIHLPPLTPFYSDPGGLELLDYQVVLQPVSTSEMNPFTNINVTPNPATHLLQLQFNSSKRGRFEISILNVLGETLQTKEISSNGTTINEKFPVEQFSPGIYLLRIQSGSYFRTVKFIRE